MVGIKLRREANAQAYEQSEKYLAMEKLASCGLTTKLSDLKLFHGRASGESDNWKVKADFDNSGNITGNQNINQISALNTSSLDTAQKFAEKRANRTATSSEVHRIVTSDKDAAIINSEYFDWSNLSELEIDEIKSAISQISPGIFIGSPLRFEDQSVIGNLSPRDFTNQYGLVFEEDLESIAKKVDINLDTTRQICSAINTRECLRTYPRQTLRSLMRAFINNRHSINITAASKNHSAPINFEYLSNFFRSAHIVGINMPVTSATLDGEIINNYLLFDLEKVNTEQAMEERAERLSRRFGEIALAGEQKAALGSDSLLTANLNSNLYISPQEIIKLAKDTPGFKEIFEADAGNWEQFTLEEHTETVLRLFDANFADIMPASTLPIMRLALLVHDLGKPLAAKNHDKAHQDKYNIPAAKNFMNQNGIDDLTQNLVISMIGKGMKFSEKWAIQHDESVDGEFYLFCKQAIRQYIGTNEVDRETIAGFRDMLLVLQTCDSAAYTTMAITRSTKSGIMYRNYGSFNSSFNPFHGFTGTRASLKKK